MFKNGDLVYIDHGHFFMNPDDENCFRIPEGNGMLCIITDVNHRCQIEILHPSLGFIYSSHTYLRIYVRDGLVTDGFE